MTRRGRLILGAAALLCSVAQCRMMLLIYRDQYVNSVMSDLWVTEGTPHWAIYQSRVLGPFLVKGLAAVVGTYLQADIAFAILTTALTGYLMFDLAVRLGYRRSEALCVFLIFQFLHVFLFNPPWIYSWDYLDSLFFTLFVYFALAKRDWRWVLVVFAAAILNHETAFYMTLWMVIDPFARWLHERRGGIPAVPLDRQMITAGVFASLAGAGVIQLLRPALLVSETGPKIFHNVGDHAGRDLYVFQLRDNLHFMWDALFHPMLSMNMLFLVPLFLISSLTVWFALARAYPDRWLGLALTHGLLVLSFVLFGFLAETRIFQPLVPALAFGIPLLARGRDRKIAY